SLDAGVYLAVAYRHAAFENASDDAFLLPSLPFANFAIGIKAGQLRAGSSPAGRAIVGLARAKHEILAVDARHLRWTKQFDVINFFAIGSGYALIAKRLADRPGKVRELVDISQDQFHRVLAYQEEPVPSPCDVSTHLAVSRDLNCNVRRA